ncbi:hypothetical protein DXG03_000016 [Asterophora parasitica]|uniref:Uncharacterized protein n=1 Tax=Asterophora parasitica TaxID=117018 RepID=A0A9P7GJX3_9AGAR|nr:hypothetical protein DXG03_000016 [Asterophora parasitica]
MDWQRLQSQIVSVKSDVQVLLDGYPDNGTQSAILCPRSAKGRTTLNQEGTVPTPDASAIESPGTSSKANPKNDEIIIVENVDELVEHQDLLLPISPVQTNYEPHMRYPSPLQLPESAQSKTHELNEPIYVVKSGVLSLSSQGDGGHFAFETWPSTASPASWNASDGSVFSDYITSMILDQPEPDKESASLPSTTSKKPAVGRRACSTGRIQASFNYDIENQERPTIDEPFVRYELTLEDPCLRLTLSQSDKIRRLLQLDATTALAVSMRGSVDLIDTALLKYVGLGGHSSHLTVFRHQRTLKTPTSGESIDAACILRAGDEYVTIFGHARDAEQVSWRRAQHGTNQSESRHLVRPWNTAKKGGVSATTSMIQPLQFATGGYDHVVHLWDVKPDLSSASHRQLAIKHTSLVQSLLAIRDTSHKLVSAGADCNVHFWDLASERVVNTLRPSNATYHIHKTTSPFCTLLEIAHRELQFEVRDHRLVPESPVLRFGYNTNKVHGRFIKGCVHRHQFYKILTTIKGATSSDLFACGSRDGPRLTPFLAMSTRLRHREDVEEAHEIQKRAGIRGGLRATAVGLGLAIIVHYSWPAFRFLPLFKMHYPATKLSVFVSRRQTLAFKGFLVSGFTVFGLVFGAENALQAHEAQQRYHENVIRKEARYDLARRGIVPTETEIAKWKRERAETASSEPS